MKIFEITQPNIAMQLIRQYSGRKIRFRDLPEVARKAILTRAGEHTENPRINPNKLIGYVEIPMKALQQAVMQRLQRDDAPFKNFDEYHQWYTSHGDTPSHTELWPIELDSHMTDFDDLILDGSHRFHSYVRSGVLVVPAIY
jgi:hypothetical protein